MLEDGQESRVRLCGVTAVRNARLDDVATQRNSADETRLPTLGPRLLPLVSVRKNLRFCPRGAEFSTPPGRYPDMP